MDVTFNSLSGAFRANPYPPLHALRAHDPVHFIRGLRSLPLRFATESGFDSSMLIARG